MAIEIERKFLLSRELPRELLNVVRKQEILQGYLNTDAEKVVRVRVSSNSFSDIGFLTVKGRSNGISREELETELMDARAARQMIEKYCSGVIHKIRYTFPAKVDGEMVLDKNLQPLSWEVDEFLDGNQGLWIAEIELPAEDTPLIIPSWCGKEVSTDHKYTNVYLAQNPYTSWESAGREA